MATVDVRDRRRRHRRHRRAAGRDLRRAGQHPADPPGRRGPAGRGPPGHARHQDPRRGPRRWPQAVPPEGHRPRPSGLDPRAAVRRRWRRARPHAARLRPADAEEDEGRRAARRPLRPGPRRPGARGRAFVDGDAPSTKTALAALQAVTERPQRAGRARPRTTWPAGRACATWPRCTCSTPDQLNTYDVLVSDDVVFTRAALDAFLGPTGKSAGRPSRERGGRRERRSPDPRDVLLAPVDLGEELRAARREQVHVPGPPGRQQDRDQDRGREGLRRQGVGVNTLNRQGKRKRTRYGFGSRKDTKRAIVSLAEGDRIDIFGGPVA